METGMALTEIPVVNKGYTLVMVGVYFGLSPSPPKQFYLKE